MSRQFNFQASKVKDHTKHTRNYSTIDFFFPSLLTPKLQMPIIKPGLIRYRSKRSNAVHQNSLKYATGSSRLDYGTNVDSRKRHKNLLKFAGRHQINELTFNFPSNKKSANPHFLRFASRIPHLQQLSISLVKNLASDTKSHNLKKLFRKLFSQNKHLLSIKATFIDQEFNPPILIKSLSRLRSLKSLHLNFRFYAAATLTPTIQSLAVLLQSIYRRQNWPKLTSQSFAFHLTPDITNEAPLSKAFLNFNQVIQSKPRTLDLLFYFIPPTNSVNLDDTAAIIEAASSDIISLGLGGRCNVDFHRFLDILKEKKKLKNLNLFLFEQEQFKLLNFLPMKLTSMDSLRVLDLRFELINDLPQLNYFAKKIAEFTQIERLTMTFARHNTIEDQTLAYISESLLNLQQLKKLLFNCIYQGLNSKVTSAGVKKAFEMFGKMENLEHLHVNFSHYNEIVNDETVKVLWDSLKNLKKVNNLTVELSYNNIGSTGLKGLAKVIGFVENVENLVLGFDGCYWMDSEGLVSLFNRLGGLRMLGSLTLHLKCEQMDDEFIKGFQKMGYQLRCLNYLAIWFYRSYGGYGSQMISLLEAVRLLQRRIALEFNCLFIE